MPTTRAVPNPASLPQAIQLVFAPLHKRAFGTAVGTACALAIFGATLVFDARRSLSGGPGLWLLQQYLAGYSVSLLGALVGAAWGFFIGFVGGWFLAFCRNLSIAVTVFFIRARAELNQTSDFLDHI